MKRGMCKTLTGMMTLLILMVLALGTETFAYQLHGTIYGGSNPLPNAKVDLINATTFANISSTTSNGSGAYGLPVANGTYNLSVTPPSGSGFSQSAVNGITVNGADVTQNVILMQQAVTVSGTVRSSDATAVQGATVYFKYAGTSTIAKTITTDASGAYSATLSPGTYDIEVYATKGSSNHVSSNVRYYFYSQSFSATATKDLLLTTVKVTGKTTDSSGAPIAGASLAVSYTSSSNFYLSSENATSDANGTYTLYLPPYNGYSVTITPPAGNPLLAPTSFNGQNFSADTVKDFALSSAITVSGTVKSSDAAAVQGANVYFKYAGSSTVAKTITTDASGAYSTTLAPGTYDIEVYATKGSSNHVSSNVRYYFYSQPFSATATKDLLLPTVKVTGKTTDSSGAPIAGASLAVSYTSSPNFYLNAENATSDANGTYTLYLPPYNGYSVNITPPAGNVLLAPTGFNGQNFSADTVKDFALSSAITVSGTVKSSDATAVQGATVYFRYAGTSTAAKTITTTASGAYSTTLAPGTYDIEVYATKGSSNHVSSNVRYYFYGQAFPAATTRDLLLSTVKVTGKTTDSNGVPIAGVSLTVSYTSGSNFYLNSETATSDANGTYTLYLPPYNGYSVNITPPAGSGFASQMLNSLNYSADLLQNIILNLPDTKPPVVVSGPSVSAITNNSAVVEWQTSEPTTATLKYGTANPPAAGVSVTPAKSVHSQTLSGLSADTTYYVSVAATDVSGNGPVNSQVVSFRTKQVVDTTPPSILEGPIVTSITQNSAVVVWTTDEPSTGVLSYGLTSNPATTKADTAQTTAHRLTLMGLAADTLYFVKVAATDLKGNGPTTSAVIPFRTLVAADPTPPVIVEGPMAINISDTEATIVWKTDEPATSGVSYNDGVAYGVTSDAGLVTDHSVRLTGLKPSTAHTYTVSSTDAPGNGPTLSQPATFKTLTSPDITPPVIIERSVVVHTTHQSAVIFWRTDEPGDSLVEFGKADTLGSSEGKAALVTHHTITLTGLEQGTLYYFRVSSKDAVGNGPTVSSILTFTTDTLPKAKNLVITKGPDVVDLSYNQATISWETDIPADSAIDYATPGVPGTVRVSDAKREKKHQLTVTNLTQSTPYTATIISSSVDGAGAKAPISFTTLNPPDTDAPQIIDGPTAIGITDSKASIKWRTDRAADSRVYFGIQGQPMDNFEGETKYLKEHVVVLTNLQPATTYSYYVKSYDPKGNGPATSSVWTFTTKGTADTTGPTISTPAVSGITDSQAVITWTTGEPATTQVAFGLAADLLNSQTAKPGLSEGHDITLTNLAAETTYYVKAVSADTTGNLSESEVISFTTTAAPRYWKVTPTATGYGAISPSTVQTVLEGNTSSFTLAPATGYMIGSVSGCGGILTGDTFTTGPVTADCTVTAQFVSDKPTAITLTASQPSPQLVGSTITFTASGSGGKGTYEYEFYLQSPGSSVWVKKQAYSSTASWSWNTTGLAAGTYQISAWIKTAGSTPSNGSYDVSKVISYIINPLDTTGLTVTPGVASPQAVGTGVTFTAAGAGGTGSYDYEFYLQAPGSTTWVKQQAYSSTATWSWNTTGLAAGTYQICAWVKTTGTTPVNGTYDVSKTVSYTLDPVVATGLTVTPSTVSPQFVGSTITFTAAGAGGNSSYDYEFYLQAPDSTAWIKQQAYSGTPTWAWSTTGMAAGTYQILAWVKTAGATPVNGSYDVSKIVSYTLNPSATTGLAVTTDAASPQAVGTTVTLTAAGSGGSGSYEYEFYLQAPGSTIWVKKQAYSATPTWAWNTTGLAAGTYQLCVWVRTTGTTPTNGTYDVSKTIPYTLNPVVATDLTVTPSVASPQFVGTAVTFTAAGAGGNGNYDYEFYLLAPGSAAWVKKQAYSSAATWDWNTAGLAAGTYQILAWVKTAGSTPANGSYDVSKTLSYTVNPVATSGLTVTPSVATPQAVGTAVTLTAAASGGNGSYEYEFYLQAPSSTTWVKKQAYSSTATWAWNTTGLATGTYQLCVWVKTTGTTPTNGMYDVSKTLSYTLNTVATTGLTLTPSVASPQFVSTGVTITAAGSGGTGSYEYEFYLQSPGSAAWVKKQAYSAAATWAWNTAGLAAGTYQICVWTKSAGTTPANGTYDVSKTLSFTLNSAASNGLTVTPSVASPQAIGTGVTFTAAGSGGTGSYEYEFYLQSPGSAAWVKKQAYSATATWAWNTAGLAPGIYQVCIWVKTAGTTPVNGIYDVSKVVSFTLNSIATTGLSVTPSVASPQFLGTGVTFTAAGAGGSGSYEYEFYLQSPGSAAWVKKQAYSSTPTWAWNTTGLTLGTYQICVWVKTAGTTPTNGTFDKSTTVSYVLNPLPAATGITVTPSVAGPQPAGTNVTFTAAGSGGNGNYEYEFYLLAPGSAAWVKKQAYSSTATWAWNTTGLAPGAYQICVWVRTAGTTPSPYDKYTVVNYTLQ